MTTKRIDVARIMIEDDEIVDKKLKKITKRFMEAPAMQIVHKTGPNNVAWTSNEAKYASTSLNHA